MQESPVLDIPDLSILEYTEVDGLLKNFEHTWGVMPQAVALPIFGAHGVPFQNDLIEPIGLRYAGADEAVSLGEIAREFAARGQDIFLVVQPALSFIHTDALHVVDIVGDKSARTCIGKSATRRLLSILTASAIRHVSAQLAQASSLTSPTGALRGIVLDLSGGLWPMGAHEERIELCCFCQDCREQLGSMSTRGKNLVGAFERFPNPWNLVLQDSGSGIVHISSLEWDTPPERIVEISRLKGFDKELRERYGADLSPDAVVLLEYMKARHQLTLSAAKDLLRRSFDEGHVDEGELRRILILESSRYDWSSGLFFEKVDDLTVCDEVWTNASADLVATQNVAMRPYMWSRSRYLLDHFFELWASCQSEEKAGRIGLGKLSPDGIRKLLELRRGQAMAAALTSKLDLHCLPELTGSEGKGRIGFVGVGLSEVVSRRLVEGTGRTPSAVDGGELLGSGTVELLLKSLGQGQSGNGEAVGSSLGEVPDDEPRENSSR